ncbi:MAG: hypothetical protein EXR99_00810 [Gemmataceae bacterium]|nr:hypothetical protein [Gemmataceae bacterium]
MSSTLYSVDNLSGDPPGAKQRFLQPGVLGGFLSYLVPGLGQAVQGRIGKALLFFFCLNALFYYGLYLGNFKNVYLPRAKSLAPQTLESLGLPLKFPNPIVYRPQFMGQFWIGVSAWPALAQFFQYDEEENPGPDPLLGTYQRTPPEAELNLLQNHGDKSWDLGWVYTVIAGCLNVMVIFDAFAGPVAPPEEKPRDKRE